MHLDIVLQLADTNFLLGYLEESLNLYKKARKISPDNLQIIKAEIKVRVLLENNNLSKETINLLHDILIAEPQNLLALYVLGDYSYNKKDYSKAHQMFKVLQGLLKEGTQEYNDIEKKILEMEKSNEKSNK